MPTSYSEEERIYHKGFRDGWDAALLHLQTTGSTPSFDYLTTGKDKRSSPKAKKNRKPSKYNLEYKEQYAKLKKNHPRTSFAALAKKAHKETKKALK